MLRVTSGELPSSIFGVSWSPWLGPYGYKVVQPLAGRRIPPSVSQHFKDATSKQNICGDFTPRLCKRAEEVEENDWTF